MNPLTFVRVEIRAPRYDPHPERSLSNNSSWRQGFFIVFTDPRGQELDYMPKWSELDLFIEKKKEVEDLNKRLCREHNGGTI